MRFLHVLVSLVLLFCTATAATAGNRKTVFLDGPRALDVYNISNYPDHVIQTLVLAADRSTREGCPYDAPDYRGLIETTDRVVISDNYIAWLDVTEKVPYTGTNPYPNKYSRSGEMAGYWALDPIAQTFKYFTNSGTCWNWPRNMLIPGSASRAADGTNRFWWDIYGPGVEHSVVIKGRLFTHSTAQRVLGGTAFNMTIDGDFIGANVLFRSRGVLGTAEYDPLTFSYPQIDIEDGDDRLVGGNGVAAAVISEVEYEFSPTEVINRWLLFPTIDSTKYVGPPPTFFDATNLYVFYWTSYAPGQTACPSYLYPSPSVPFFNLYTQSSRQLKIQETGTPFPLGQVVSMPYGAPCTAPNIDVQNKNAWVANSDVALNQWIRVGEGNPLTTSGMPYLTLINQTAPNSLDGSTAALAKQWRWNRMLSWNEAATDGTVGVGFASGPYEPIRSSLYTKFDVNKFYRTVHTLKSIP